MITYEIKMRLYYTNSETFLGNQSNPARSLGGYISSTPVPNNLKGSLFDNVSRLSREQRLTQVIALAVVLEGSEDTVSIEVGEGPFLYEYAFEEIETRLDPITRTSPSFITLIANPQASPLLQFTPLAGRSELSVGSERESEYLGLWLRRSWGDPTLDVSGEFEIRIGTLIVGGEFSDEFNLDEFR